MMKRLLFVLVFVLAVVPTALAHETFRIVGTVTRLTQDWIGVRNADSKTVTMRINKQTDVTRDKKKVVLSEVKVGQSVVVDAYGDNELELLALEIRMVPPPRK